MENLNNEVKSDVSASSDSHSISASDVLNPFKTNPPEYQDLVKAKAEEDVLIPDTEPTAEELSAQKKAEEDEQAAYDKKAAEEVQAKIDEAGVTAEPEAVQEPVNPLDPAQAEIVEPSTSEDGSRKSKSRS